MGDIIPPKISKKLFAAIHAGNIIENTDLEGGSIGETFVYLQWFLKNKQSVIGVSTEIDKMLAVIQEVRKIYDKKYSDLAQQKEEIEKRYPSDTKNQQKYIELMISHNVQEITEQLQQYSTSLLTEYLDSSVAAITLPCGYNGIGGNPGHGMLMRINREVDGSFSLKIFNTGEGLDFHSTAFSEEDGQEFPNHVFAIKDLSLADIQSKELQQTIGKILSYQIIPDLEQKQVKAKIIYDTVKKMLIELNSKAVIATPQEDFYRKGQKSGICFYYVVKPWLRELFDKQYDTVHVDIKLDSLQQFYEQVKEDHFVDKEAVDLLRHATEKMARTAIRLKQQLSPDKVDAIKALCIEITAVLDKNEKKVMKTSPVLARKEYKPQDLQPMLDGINRLVMGVENRLIFDFSELTGDDKVNASLIEKINQYGQLDPSQRNLPQLLQLNTEYIQMLEQIPNSSHYWLLLQKALANQILALPDAINPFSPEIMEMELPQIQEYFMQLKQLLNQYHQACKYTDQHLTTEELGLPMAKLLTNLDMLARVRLFKDKGIRCECPLVEARNIITKKEDYRQFFDPRYHAAYQKIYAYLGEPDEDEQSPKLFRVNDQQLAYGVKAKEWRSVSKGKDLELLRTLQDKTKIEQLTAQFMFRQKEKKQQAQSKGNFVTLTEDEYSEFLLLSGRDDIFPESDQYLADLKDANIRSQSTYAKSFGLLHKFLASERLSLEYVENAEGNGKIKASASCYYSSEEKAEEIKARLLDTDDGYAMNVQFKSIFEESAVSEEAIMLQQDEGAKPTESKDFALVGSSHDQTEQIQNLLFALEKHGLTIRYSEGELSQSEIYNQIKFIKAILFTDHAQLQYVIESSPQTVANLLEYLKQQINIEYERAHVDTSEQVTHLMIAVNFSEILAKLSIYSNNQKYIAESEELLSKCRNRIQSLSEQLTEIINTTKDEERKYESTNSLRNIIKLKDIINYNKILILLKKNPLSSEEISFMLEYHLNHIDRYKMDDIGSSLHSGIIEKLQAITSTITNGSEVNEVINTVLQKHKKFNIDTKLNWEGSFPIYTASSSSGNYFINLLTGAYQDPQGTLIEIPVKLLPKFLRYSSDRVISARYRDGFFYLPSGMCLFFHSQFTHEGARKKDSWINLTESDLCTAYLMKQFNGVWYQHIPETTDIPASEIDKQVLTFKCMDDTQQPEIIFFDWDKQEITKKIIGKRLITSHDIADAKQEVLITDQTLKDTLTPISQNAIGLATLGSSEISELLLPNTVDSDGSAVTGKFAIDGQLEFTNWQGYHLVKLEDQIPEIDGIPRDKFVCLENGKGSIKLLLKQDIFADTITTDKKNIILSISVTDCGKLEPKTLDEKIILLFLFIQNKKYDKAAVYIKNILEDVNLNSTHVAKIRQLMANPSLRKDTSPDKLILNILLVKANFANLTIKPPYLEPEMVNKEPFIDEKYEQYLLSIITDIRKFLPKSKNLSAPIQDLWVQNCGSITIWLNHEVARYLNYLGKEKKQQSSIKPELFIAPIVYANALLVPKSARTLVQKHPDLSLKIELVAEFGQTFEEHDLEYLFMRSDMEKIYKTESSSIKPTEIYRLPDIIINFQLLYNTAKSARTSPAAYTEILHWLENNKGIISTDKNERKQEYILKSLIAGAFLGNINAEVPMQMKDSGGNLDLSATRDAFYTEFLKINQQEFDGKSITISINVPQLDFAEQTFSRPLSLILAELTSAKIKSTEKPSPVVVPDITDISSLQAIYFNCRQIAPAKSARTIYTPEEIAAESSPVVKKYMQTFNINYQKIASEGKFNIELKPECSSQQLQQNLQKIHDQSQITATDLEIQIIDLINTKPDASKLQLELDLLTLGKKHRQLTIEDAYDLYGCQDDYLLNKMTFLNPEQQVLFRTLMTKYLLATANTQQCVRALVTTEDVARYNALGQRNYTVSTTDPTSRIKLLMEVKCDLLLRKAQCEKLDRLNTIDPKTDTYVPIISQLMMGEGKSKIITPLLARIRANGSSLPFVIVPEVLYDITKSDIHARTYSVYGQRAETFTLTRGIISKEEIILCREGRLLPKDQKYANATTAEKLLAIKKEKIAAIKEKIKQALADNAYFIVTADTMRSLDLAYVDALYYNQVELVAELTEIKTFLKKHGEAIIDEADTILDTRIERHNTLGEKYYLPKQEIDLILAIYRILNKTPKHEQPDMVVLAKQIAELEILGLTPKQQEEFIAVINSLLNKEPQPKSLSFLAELSDSNRALVCLAKEELVKHLPLTLAMKAEVNFGFSRTRDITYAIPYLANNHPNEKSDFASIYETANYTIQLCSQGLLPDRIIIAFFNKQLTAAREESTLTNTSIEDSLINQSFKRRFGIDLQELIATKNWQDIVIRFNQYLASDYNKVEDFLQTEILRTIHTFPEKASHFSPNLVDLFHSCQCFTGTPWNISSLHNKFTADLEAGTEERVAHAIIEKLDNPAVVVVTEANPAMMCDELMQQSLDEDLAKLHAIIDVGANFAGMDNTTVANAFKKFFEKHSKLKGQLYFDLTTSRLSILKHDDSQVVELLGSDYEYVEAAGFSPETLITYYDHANTRGLDIKQDPQALALVTVDDDTTARDLFQGAFRMRKLLEQQQVKVIVPQRVYDKLLVQAKKAKGERLTSLDIVKLTGINQAHKLGDDNCKGLTQNIRNIFRCQCENILASKTPAEQIVLFKLLKSWYLTIEATNPYILFASDPELQDPKQVYSDWLATLLTKFEEDLTVANISADTIIAQVKEESTKLISAALADAYLPAAIPSKTVGSSGIVENQVEVMQQQQVQQEIMQQVQVQQQVTDDDLVPETNTINFSQKNIYCDDLIAMTMAEPLNTKLKGLKLQVGSEDIELTDQLYGQEIYVSQNFTRTVEGQPNAMMSDLQKIVQHLFVIVDPDKPVKLLIVDDAETVALRTKMLQDQSDGSSRKIYQYGIDGKLYDYGKNLDSQCTADGKPDLSQEKLEQLQTLIMQCQHYAGCVRFFMQPEFKNLFFHWVKSHPQRQVLDAILRENIKYSAEEQGLYKLMQQQLAQQSTFLPEFQNFKTKTPSALSPTLPLSKQEPPLHTPGF